MTHSSDDIYGIAGRIDKVDLTFHADFDLMQTHQKFLRGLADSIQDDTGRYIGFRVKCFSAEKEGRKRIYGVSTWGPGSDDFLQLLPSEYHTNISRVDFRIETEVSASGLAGVEKRADEFNPRNRNIHKFSTRKRQKDFGRNSGGNGLGFGSHKSDVRLTMYKRAGETGAVEIQLSGKRLSNLIHNMYLPLHGEFRTSFYAELADSIIQYIPVLSKEMGYPEFSQLLAELGATEYNLSWSELVEQRLAEVRTAWENLPQQQQSDFFTEIQAAVISNFSKLA